MELGESALLVIQDKNQKLRRNMNQGKNHANKKGKSKITPQGTNPNVSSIKRRGT